MKNALQFIKDLRNSSELCEAVEFEFSKIDNSDPDESLKCLVAVGSLFGYEFTAKDYKLAAEEYSKTIKKLAVSHDKADVLEGPWTTGGISCVGTCPTRSDVC
jgi:hypothetical protein